MAWGGKGIVLAPCDPEVVAPTVDKMSAQNVQTLLLNVDVPQSSRLCYVGSDYVQAGRLAAELLGQMMKGRGRVAPIIFPDRGNMIPQKLTGFREEIGRYPEIEILGPYSFSRTGEGVYEDTLKLIQSESPDALFMSYGQTENVARAIKDAEMAEKILLVGFDTSEEVLSYLDKRVISAVIAQGPARQGMLCVRLLYDFLVQGIRPRSSLVHAKLEIITHQNCRYYRRDSLNVCTYAYRVDPH